MFIECKIVKYILHLKEKILIIGIGIDIIEIERIKRAVGENNFLNRFFTQAEISYCEQKNKQKFASYAARFAAKEALVKALGTGFTKGNFTDICVKNNQEQMPYIELSGHYLLLAQSKNVQKIHLSISHCKEYAVAQVVLEG